MTDATQPVSSDEDAFYADPAGFFGHLRETGTITRVPMPDYGRAWVITRYDDVRTALTDPRLAKDISRFPGGGLSRPSESVNLHTHMLNNDPPVHTRLRRLVQQAFTPRRVAQLRPRTEEIAAGLLDELAAAEGGGELRGGVPTVDLLERYARPVPVTVLCEMLGVPEADRGWIAADVVAYGDVAQRERVTRELAGYLADLIAARHKEPGDDLISALVRARDEGGDDRLTHAELLSSVYQLIMAGFDTTVNLIANGTVALLTHPEQAQRLRADPSLLPAAVEELLRFTNPLNHATDRFTTEDVPFGDVVIPAGEWVLIATSAANRDPDRFPDPDRLDLDRDAAGHVAFGHGIHHCVGAPLARMEAEVALGALLARFPGLRLAVPPQALRRRRARLMNGLESLPVNLG